MIETHQFILSAVNLCLAGIGREPVPELETPDLDSAMALAIIEQVSLDLQNNGGKGWWFNTERGWKLPLQKNGSVNLPNNTLSLLQERGWGGEPQHQLSIRGNRLYDTEGHTYDLSLIADDFIQVSLIMLLPFEDLPVTARSAIAWRSRFLFSSDMVGNPEVLKVEETNVGMAMQALTSEHSRSTRRNALTDNKLVNNRLGRIGGVNNFNY